MILLRSLVSALSMFSRLPMPNLTWRGDNMKYMMLFFPVVGAIIGAAVWLWLLICQTLGFGTILTAAGLTLTPIIITGGIHLDGFCDTVDALASHASPERKREILKDPHTGAFAVIGIVVYLLLYFSVCSELKITSTLCIMLGFIFIMSRILSGLSVLVFPKSVGQGLLSTFKDAAEKKISVAILLTFFIICTASLVFLNALVGSILTAVALLCFVWLYFFSRRKFEGMSGDLAGYFLQLCELFMLTAIIVLQKVVKL